MKIFENKIDKTKKLMLNKVQLYPLSSLSFNLFYEKKKANKQTKKKERKVVDFTLNKGLLQMHSIAVSL